MLCLRSTAAARAGDVATAHQSLLIAMRLFQADMDEPFLIGSLLACADASCTSSAAWELCDAHSGSVDDFRILQDALSQIDFQTSLLRAERGEIALNLANKAKIESQGRTLVSNFFIERGDDKPTPAVASRVVPNGLLDSNTAILDRWRYDYSIEPLRDSDFETLLAKRNELNALITEHRKQPFFMHFDELIAQIAMPADSGVINNVVYAQCLVNEAIAACALERYRIEHGTYPDSLAEANHPGEKPIPLDVISGKPMGYRNTPNGKYALWCVGFDGKDDGGKRVLDAKVPNITRFSDPAYIGDWVWDFPAK
jgi:hypothetical protein